MKPPRSPEPQRVAPVVAQPAPGEPRRIESAARMTAVEPIHIVNAGDGYAGDNPNMMRPAGEPTSVIPPLKPVETDPALLAMFPRGRIVEASAALSQADLGRPWHPIADADAMKNGTLLEGRAEDGAEFMMIWRNTSRHNGIRWVRTGFWSSHLSREPLGVEPVEWRMPDGFMMPGAVVA